jgi:hypothetical protein
VVEEESSYCFHRGGRSAVTNWEMDGGCSQSTACIGRVDPSPNLEQDDEKFDAFQKGISRMRSIRSYDSTYRLYEMGICKYTRKNREIQDVIYLSFPMKSTTGGYVTSS